jgi:hypothetical protein
VTAAQGTPLPVSSDFVELLEPGCGRGHPVRGTVAALVQKTREEFAGDSPVDEAFAYARSIDGRRSG